MKVNNDTILNINARGKYGNSKDKALEPKVREQVLKSLQNNKDRVIFILTAYAGLRVGELQQLRTSWISRSNFGDKEVLCIDIPNECRDINNKYSIWRPKTKRARRTYLFDKELFLEVENYYKYNESINLSVRGLQQKSYRLFKVNIHALRATAQNYFKYELNLTTEIIAVMLGHKDIRTTLQHYTSLNTAQAESYLIKHYKEMNKQ